MPRPGGLRPCQRLPLAAPKRHQLKARRVGRDCIDEAARVPQAGLAAADGYAHRFASGDGDRRPAGGVPVRQQLNDPRVGVHQRNRDRAGRRAYVADFELAAGEADRHRHVGDVGGEVGEVGDAVAGGQHAERHPAGVGVHAGGLAQLPASFVPRTDEGRRRARPDEPVRDAGPALVAQLVQRGAQFILDRRPALSPAVAANQATFSSSASAGEIGTRAPGR